MFSSSKVVAEFHKLLGKEEAHKIIGKISRNRTHFRLQSLH